MKSILFGAAVAILLAGFAPLFADALSPSAGAPPAVVHPPAPVVTDVEPETSLRERVGMGKPTPAPAPQKAPVRELPTIQVQAATPGCYTHSPEIFKVREYIDEGINLASASVEAHSGGAKYINIDLSNLSHADSSWLPSIFWPGNTVVVRYEECGNAPILSVLEATVAAGSRTTEPALSGEEAAIAARWNEGSSIPSCENSPVRGCEMANGTIWDGKMLPPGFTVDTPAPTTRTAKAAPPPVDTKAIEKRAHDQGYAEALAEFPGVTRW